MSSVKWISLGQLYIKKFFKNFSKIYLGHLYKKLEKVKKNLQSSRGRNQIPMHFFYLGHCLMSPALHPGSSDL